MEYGPEIKVNGVRPAWLRDEENIMTTWRHGEVAGPYFAEYIYGWEGSVTAIALPTDHPYYLATSRGFTYWPGGDDAPGDWEPGSEVLWRNGNVKEGQWWNWCIGQKQGGGEPKESDIIGYRPKASFKAGDYVVHLGLADGDISQPYAGFTVGNVYRLEDDGSVIDDDRENRPFFPKDFRPATPAEIAQYQSEEALVAQMKGEPLPASSSDCVTINKMTCGEAMSRGLLCETVGALGLLLDEPLIDRFDREHGSLDDNQRDILETFIAWQEKQS